MRPPERYRQTARLIESLLDLSTMTIEEAIGRLKEQWEARRGGKLHLTQEQWEARRGDRRRGEPSSSTGGRKRGKPRKGRGGAQAGARGRAEGGARGDA